MRIVVAPNAFKGSLTARQAAEAMAAGVARAVADVEIVQVPVADGGDGLVDVALQALGGEPRTLSVTGPLGEPVEVTFCHVPAMRFAAIEMALASGLALVPADRRDVMRATTRGTGELIAAALDLGAVRSYSIHVWAKEGRLTTICGAMVPRSRNTKRWIGSARPVIRRMPG